MALFLLLSSGPKSFVSAAPAIRDLIQKSSEMRSISSIVSSCLFTVLGCSWICARPNIPAPHHSRSRILRAKLNIFFWIVISPELVVYWAFRQWVEGNAIAKKYEGEGWTRTHGQFIIMGGFMLYVDGRPYQTLSIRKFTALLEEGLIDFPVITEKEIHTRGHHSPFLKGMAGIQAVWFIIECSARFSRHLFVTQLEFLTLAFVVMNTLLYSLWWYKPLDVQHPVRVDLKCAVHGLEGMGERRESDFKREERIQKHIVERMLDPAPPVAKARSRFSRFLHFVLDTFILWPFGSLLRDIVFILYGPRSSAMPVDTLSVPLFYYPETTHIPLHLSIAAASLLGGALNGVNSIFFTQSFPSSSEQLVWKVGTYLTAGSSGVAIMLNLILHAGRHIDLGPTSRRSVKILRYGLVVMVVVLFCSGHLAYLAGRFTLIVDAFICLRDVPEGALNIVGWTTYIPHIA